MPSAFSSLELLDERAFGAFGNGLGGLGTIMTIITITTRMRGESG